MSRKVSIIIPCRTFAESFKCVVECKKIAYDNIEIIVLTDTGGAPDGECVKYICTGKVLPARKRDLGIEASTGEIIAFIDADAYPFHLWLKRAVLTLESDPGLAGVCGPGILPPDSNTRQRVTDNILKILPFSYRVTPKPARYVDEFPTFNLIFWKKDIVEAGGFNCNYLTGEDTRLCEKVRAKGKKIRYTPTVCVFHERREIFKPFFKQIGTYGKHRGHFIKKHQGSSMNPLYLAPLFLCGIIITVLCYLFVKAIGGVSWR